jgi:hypothetical protein
VGVVSPLDIGTIDTINFGGYVLWSVWLIWFAVVLLRSRAVPVVAVAETTTPTPVPVSW